MNPTLEDPNMLQRASRALDEYLAMTGIPYVVGQAGRKVGEGADWLFNTETLADVGQSVGEGLPRMAVETAPWFVAGPVGWLGRGALWGARGLGMVSAGAKTYEETDNPWAGLLSGGMVAAFPAAARAAESTAAEVIGRRLLPEAAQDLGLAGLERGSLGQIIRGTNPLHTAMASHGLYRAPRYLAGQAGLGATAVSHDAAQAAITGQPFDPLSPEYIFGQALGQLPFLGLDVVRMRGEAQNARDPITTQVGAVAGRTDPVILRGRQSVVEPIARRGQLLAETSAEQQVELTWASEAMRRVEANDKTPIQVLREDGTLESVTPQQFLKSRGMKKTDAATLARVTDATTELAAKARTAKLKTPDEFKSLLDEYDTLTTEVADTFPLLARRKPKTEGAGVIKQQMGWNLSRGDTVELAYSKAQAYLKYKVETAGRGKKEGFRDIREIAEDFATKTGLTGRDRERFVDFSERLSLVDRDLLEKQLQLAKAAIGSTPETLSFRLGLDVAPESPFAGKTKAHSQLVGWYATHFDGASPELQRFMFANLLGHGVVTRMFERDSAEAPQKPEYANAKRAAEALTPEDRKMMLTSMLDVLIPEKYLKAQDGSRHTALEGLTDFASKDADEFMHLLGTMMVTSMQAGGPKVADKVTEFMKSSDPHMAEFARGILRNVEGISATMKQHYAEVLHKADDLGDVEGFAGEFDTVFYDPKTGDFVNYAGERVKGDFLDPLLTVPLSEFTGGRADLDGVIEEIKSYEGTVTERGPVNARRLEIQLKSPDTLESAIEALKTLHFQEGKLPIKITEGKINIAKEQRTVRKAKGETERGDKIPVQKAVEETFRKLRVKFEPKFVNRVDPKIKGVMLSAKNRMAQLKIDQRTHPLEFAYILLNEGKIPWRDVKTLQDLQDWAEQDFLKRSDPKQFKLNPNSDRVKAAEKAEVENMRRLAAGGDQNARIALARYEQGGWEKVIEYVNENRANSVAEWVEYLTKTNDEYAKDPVWRALVWEIPQKALDSDRSHGLGTTVGLNAGILAELRMLSNERPIGLSKMYARKLKEFAEASAKETVKSVGERRWVYVPGKDEDAVNFEANVQKVKDLSNRDMCTHTYNAEPYLRRGGMWFLLDGEKTAAVVRLEGTKIAEIRDERNTERFTEERAQYMQDVGRLLDAKPEYQGAELFILKTTTQQQIIDVAIEMLPESIMKNYDNYVKAGGTVTNEPLARWKKTFINDPSATAQALAANPNLSHASLERLVELGPNAASIAARNVNFTEDLQLKLIEKLKETSNYTAISYLLKNPVLSVRTIDTLFDNIVANALPETLFDDIVSSQGFALRATEAQLERAFDLAQKQAVDAAEYITNNFLWHLLDTINVRQEQISPKFWDKLAKAHFGKDGLKLLNLTYLFTHVPDSARLLNLFNNILDVDASHAQRLHAVVDGLRRLRELDDGEYKVSLLDQITPQELNAFGDSVLKTMAPFTRTIASLDGREGVAALQIFHQLVKSQAVDYTFFKKAFDFVKLTDDLVKEKQSIRFIGGPTLGVFVDTLIDTKGPARKFLAEELLKPKFGLLKDESRLWIISKVIYDLANFNLTDQSAWKPEEQKEWARKIFSKVDTPEFDKQMTLTSVTGSGWRDPRKLLGQLFDHPKYKDEPPFLAKQETGEIEAYYDPRSDETVFNLDAIYSEERAAELAFHEVSHRNFYMLDLQPEGRAELAQILKGSEALLMADLPQLLKATGHETLEALKNDYGWNDSNGDNAVMYELLARKAEQLNGKAKPAWFTGVINKLVLWFNRHFGTQLTESALLDWLGNRAMKQSQVDGASIADKGKMLTDDLYPVQFTPDGDTWMSRANGDAKAARTQARTAVQTKYASILQAIGNGLRLVFSTAGNSNYRHAEKKITLNVDPWLSMPLSEIDTLMRHEVIHAVVDKVLDDRGVTDHHQFYREVASLLTPRQRRLVEKTYRGRAAEVMHEEAYGWEYIRMAVERGAYGKLTEQTVGGTKHRTQIVLENLLRDVVAFFKRAYESTPANSPQQQAALEVYRDSVRLLQKVDPEARVYAAERLNAMETLHKSIEQLLPKAAPEVRDAEETLQQIQRVLTPSQVADEGIPFDFSQLPDKVKQIAKDLKYRMALDPDDITHQGLKLGTIERFFGLPTQTAMKLARQFEPASQLISAVLGVQQKNNASWNYIMAGFMKRSAEGRLRRITTTKDSALSADEKLLKDSINLVEAEPRVNKAFSDIGRFQNEKRKFFEPQNGDKVESYERLTLDEKEKVMKLVKFTQMSNEYAAQELLRVTKSVMIFRASEWLIRDNENFRTHSLAQQLFGKYSNEKARELGEGLWQLMDDMPEIRNYEALLAQMLQQTPRQVGERREDHEMRVRRLVKDALVQQMTVPLLQRLQRQFPQFRPDETKLGSVLQSIIYSRLSHEDLTRLFNDQKWYMSERRQGRYLVTYKVGNRSASEGFHNRYDANKRLAELRNDANYSDIGVIDKGEPSYGTPEIGFFTDAVMERYRELEQRAYDEALAHALQKGMDTPQARAFALDMQNLYMPGMEFIKQLEERKTKKMMRRRKLAPGRESINMWEAAIGNWQDVANAAALSESKQLIRLMLTDEAWNEQPHLKKFLADYANEMIRPGSHEFSRFKKAVFSYWLGFNVSSILVEGGQPLLTALPEMIRQTGGFGTGLSVLKNAYEGLAKAYAFKGVLKPGQLIFVGDGDMTALFRRAFDEGLLQYGSMEDAFYSSDWADINAARMRLGEGTLTRGEQLAKPFSWYTKSAAAMYSLASGFGAKVSFHAGVEMGRKKGLTGDELYRFATDFVHSTVFSGGPSARPFLFKELGPRARGAFGAVYTLSNFTFGTLHMMFRLGKEAIAGDKSLSPAERTAAWKAFGTMMGVQFFFAGALGMPFAAAALRIIEEIMGEEYYSDLYTALDDFFSSASGDEDVGEVLSDIAMNGAASRLVGVDLQSRLGLTGILGLSAYRGFDLVDVFGASGGMVQSLFRGLQTAAQGDPVKGLTSAMPNGLRGIAEMARTKGRFEDPNGNLLYEASTPEVIARIMGFRPRKLTDIQKFRRISDLMDKAGDRTRRQSVDEIGEYLINGDVQTAQQKLIQYLEQNRDNPAINPQETVNLIVDRAVDKITPLDPLRTGSVTTVKERARLAELYRVPARTSEEQRYFLKRRMRQALGMPEQKLNFTQLRKARMVDQMLARNPTMTYQEARRAVEANN